MILRLNEIDVDCIIGERADERERPQRLLVDVELEISDLSSESDNLEDTIDYAALTKAIRSALVAAKCQMIERAARVAGDVALAFARQTGLAFAAKVSVTKVGAIPHLKSATAIWEGNLES